MEVNGGFVKSKGNYGVDSSIVCWQIFIPVYSTHEGVALYIVPWYLISVVCNKLCNEKIQGSARWLTTVILLVTAIWLCRYPPQRIDSWTPALPKDILLGKFHSSDLILIKFQSMVTTNFAIVSKLKIICRYC